MAYSNRAGGLESQEAAGEDGRFAEATEDCYGCYGRREVMDDVKCVDSVARSENREIASFFSNIATL